MRLVLSEPEGSRHEPTLSEGVSAGLKFCHTCHLVWPCLDGRVLAYAANSPFNARHTVAEIAAVIQTEDCVYLTRGGQNDGRPKTLCRRRRGDAS